MLSRKGQDALLILGGTGFENKHAAVPKPFHILKRRQSTNLWIGRPGTPVTNVISAWHRGFKPIQPPTHRPLLRLCHHNPQAGFLLPRWAGDSMCEQNSTARAARRNYYLFLAWQWRFGQSECCHIVCTHLRFGEMQFQRYKTTVEDGLCFHIRPYFLPVSVRVYLGRGNKRFLSWLIKSVSPFFLSESKHFWSAVWCMFGHNIVNKQMEMRGSGKRSAWTAHPAFMIPVGLQLSVKMLF